MRACVPTKQPECIPLQHDVVRVSRRSTHTHIPGTTVSTDTRIKHAVYNRGSLDTTSPRIPPG